ncbi:hypothetical protein F0249_17880 [Vibrio sp. 03-59-1]|nr:hypothetical protein [Vibrio sp. 03-59-1]
MIKAKHNSVWLFLVENTLQRHLISRCESIETIVLSLAAFEAESSPLSRCVLFAPIYVEWFALLN